MQSQSRRRFMSEVGKGMLVTGIGSSLAGELGISTVRASEEAPSLTFGSMEPLVSLMQQTALEKLQPLLVAKIKSGVPLKTLVAAGALANARSFAGQDYVGFHTLMALMPAWYLAEELPQARKPMPILKVLYRNTARIHEADGGQRLGRVEPAPLSGKERGGPRLLREMASGDMQSAERTFAALADRPTAEDAEQTALFNSLQHIVQDEPDVHRVALAWRAWEVLPLVGYDHAHTLLRQSVRYCVEREQNRLKRKGPEPKLRKLTPRLLDEYKLLSKKPGSRRADTAWIERMANTIFAGAREHAAEATAEALAEGFAVEDIGEAMSLAANLLVMNDPGRPEKSASPGKPKGSVHGAGIGVHASDAANAWRNIARVTNHRNQVCSLIVGAWHTAGQRRYITDSPFPFNAPAIESKKLDAGGLIRQLNESVQARNQAEAMAVVSSWHAAGRPSKPIFDCLRRYAVSEDGALHAEKYFRTVTEEFVATRPELRWRHLIGLARVSASEYGWPAPGREQAEKLLQS